MTLRYDRRGFLALDPQAFGVVISEAKYTPPETKLIGDVAVVEIRGHLEHHASDMFDSYESIVNRVTEACAGPASTIVLRIDSPGGQLLGCFDAARTIRARCAAAGKRLLAYVAGCACSAAYALACSAEQIWTSDTGFTGSIGVLLCRVDSSKLDTAMGLQYTLVASGKRKSDANSHTSISADELAALTEQCEATASIFFELVASLRGMDAGAIARLEAGIFHGVAAVEVGLADRVATMDELLAAIASGEGAMPDDNNEETTSEASASSGVEQARELLEEAAKGDGEEAERARAALSALNGPKGDDDGDEEESSSSASASAGTSVSTDAAARLAATVSQQGKEIAKLKREAEAAKLSALLATRTDLGAELTAHLQTMSFADAQALISKMPKPATPNAAATATVPGTRGATQTTNGAPPPPSPALDAGTEALNRAFGKGATTVGVQRQGSSQIFGVRPPSHATPQQTAASDAGKGSAA